MASKSSRRRKRAARRGPAEPSAPSGDGLAAGDDVSSSSPPSAGDTGAGLVGRITSTVSGWLAPATPPDGEPDDASDDEVLVGEVVTADGEEVIAEAGPQRRWGLGDAIGGWVVAQVASVLAIASLVTILGYPKVAGVGGVVGQAAGQDRVGSTLELLTVWGELPFVWQVALQIPLWVGLIGAPVYAAWRKGVSLRHDFGLWATLTRSGA